MLERILADGKITEDEKTELMAFCRNFAEITVDDPIIQDGIYQKPYMRSGAPVLKPFTELCDRKAEITFKKKSFCFTGPARTGPRKELEDMVKALGGRAQSSVTPLLNYLVIGAQSSPCWVYSTYGRKIEAVIENQHNGAETIILHEDDFVEQARETT